MEWIESVVPRLARAVVAAAVVGSLLAVAAAGITGLAGLLKFAVFSLAAGLVGFGILRKSTPTVAEVTGDQSTRAAELVL